MLAPSTPSATAGAVREALDDPDPVVIVVDRALLYGRDELARDKLDTDGASPWRSRCVRSGAALTVASTGRLVHLCVAVADELGLSAEVIDLQRLAPLDISRVVESVQRTSRLLVAHDEAACGGFASRVARAVYDEVFWQLDAPICCITSPSTPVPSGPSLEDAYVISSDDLRKAMLDLLHL